MLTQFFAIIKRIKIKKVLPAGKTIAVYEAHFRGISRRQRLQNPSLRERHPPF